MSFMMFINQGIQMKRRNIRRSQVIMFAETATNHRRVGLKFKTIVTGPDMNVMLSSKEIYQGRVQNSLSKKWCIYFVYHSRHFPHAYYILEGSQLPHSANSMLYFNLPMKFYPQFYFNFLYVFFSSFLEVISGMSV